MKSYLITFRSITYGQRAEQTLRALGKKSRLRRTPRWMEDRGCGYALEVTTGEVSELLAVLRQQQIPWRKVWLARPGGEMEELSNVLP
ncbi:MAG: DUF3343 domain-containing protein [Oscillospiraceae bacterium]|nr:DUF3343 domain-containing protein [Oscillospiraceae bacterium]